jgi:hypothetical protein
MIRCSFHETLGWEGTCQWRPDGQPDRCHLIRRQRLERDRPEVDPWDERVWVYGCRHHHHLLDHGFRRLRPEQYPPAFLAFVQDEGLFWDADRRIWLCAHREAA